MAQLGGKAGDVMQGSLRQWPKGSAGSITTTNPPA
jgi:hypothetical protein